MFRPRYFFTRPNCICKPKGYSLSPKHERYPSFSHRFPDNLSGAENRRNESIFVFLSEMDPAVSLHPLNPECEIRRGIWVKPMHFPSLPIKNAKNSRCGGQLYSLRFFDEKRLSFRFSFGDICLLRLWNRSRLRDSWNELFGVGWFWVWYEYNCRSLVNYYINGHSYHVHVKHLLFSTSDSGSII